MSLLENMLNPKPLASTLSMASDAFVWIPEAACPGLAPTFSSPGTLSSTLQVLRMAKETESQPPPTRYKKIKIKKRPKPTQDQDIMASAEGLSRPAREPLLSTLNKSSTSTLAALAPNKSISSALEKSTVLTLTASAPTELIPATDAVAQVIVL